ncbi:MAG: hypothetical protein LRZ85_07535 [Alphaproteobacteria bacterium]|nr:hypothetical protein [Alphaproteobacteria bacterium]MCD8520562.1 hypothetical protein [Alphaproteobacteria bacterium]MCD8571240.1 hypothetical protein [Alphaproteobacteria bacterium]
MHNRLIQARKNFRMFLYVMLFLSFLFAGTATAAFALVKTKTISIKEISPALFEIDIASHQIQAVFQTEEQRYNNAVRLLKKTFFSGQYMMPAKNMIKNLAYNDYAPAQYTHANLIMLNTPNETERGEAMMFYQNAADDGYEPARQRLANLELIR